jgi:D-sedoheptulose 7-phosphate isomerase
VGLAFRANNASRVIQIHLTNIEIYVTVSTMPHCSDYVSETAKIAAELDVGRCEQMVAELVALRARRGRLFCVGMGGGASAAEHACNDFRKLCDIEAYSPSWAEISAWANDTGLDECMVGWLRASRPTPNDGMFVFSVGGGTKDVSRCIMHACQLGCKVFGVVGKKRGEAAERGALVIPTVNSERLTPHTEGWQMVVLHMIVSHPSMQRAATKW